MKISTIENIGNQIKREVAANTGKTTAKLKRKIAKLSRDVFHGEKRRSFLRDVKSLRVTG
jgi:hypothetical protein